LLLSCWSPNENVFLIAFFPSFATSVKDPGTLPDILSFAGLLSYPLDSLVSVVWRLTSGPCSVLLDVILEVLFLYNHQKSLVSQP
jgi:hypothetical protein